MADESSIEPGSVAASDINNGGEVDMIAAEANHNKSVLAKKVKKTKTKSTASADQDDNKSVKSTKKKSKSTGAMTPNSKRKKKALSSDSAPTVPGIEDKSNHSSHSKKSLKSPKPKKKLIGGGGGIADDASTKSKKKKKKKPKAEGADDDDQSTTSKKRKAKKKDKVPELANDVAPPSAATAGAADTLAAYKGAGGGGGGDGDDHNLQEENEVLSSEIAILRQQLDEAKVALEEAYEERAAYPLSSTEITQMQIDLRRSQNEASELKSEIEEYEEAVSEKDGLIKKLTEAVDCQLDKVEYLEIKLQRAEEEFCKMEDEMKDMEDEIENLKMNDDAMDNNTLESNEDMLPKEHHHEPLRSDSTHSLQDVADDMQRRLLDDKIKRLQIKELEIDEFERDLEEREQELIYRDQELVEKDNEIAQAEEKIADEMEQIRMQQLILDERERDLEDLQAKLNAQQETQQHHHSSEESEADANRSVINVVNAGIDGRSSIATDKLKQQLSVKEDEIDRLSKEIGALKMSKADILEEKMKLEERITEAQNEADAKVGELQSTIDDIEAQNAALRVTNEKLKSDEIDRKAVANERDNLRDDELQALKEGVNKQLHELDSANQSLSKEVDQLKREKEELKKQIPREGLNPRDSAIAQLEEEIAELREKIVEKEQFSRRQREDVERAERDRDEARQEVKEATNELQKINAQLAESKAATSKKMEQKEETISFMQTEMLRLVKEKQAADKDLREEKTKLAEAKEALGNAQKGGPPQQVAAYSARDEEAELERIQSFNLQIRQLDEENKDLEEKLKEAEYESGLKLKNKDGKILELETELADLKWELNARKEADFVSLLKDLKDKKRDLETAKLNLKTSEDRCADVERELEELKNHQEDLEQDVEELNKSLVSRDSGDYVSGLKRQVKSLKEHNMTLERNAQVLISDTAVALRKQDEKIKVLETELDDLKNPAKAAVRGLFQFGKSERSTGSAKSEPKQNREVQDSDTSRSAPALGQTSNGDSSVVSPPSTTAAATEEQKKLGMQSLFSTLTSPLSSRSLRGFSLRGTRTVPIEEEPIHKKNESDDELEGPRENVRARSDSSDDNMSIEEELKAIENEIHSISSSRKDKIENGAVGKPMKGRNDKAENKPKTNESTKAAAQSADEVSTEVAGGGEDGEEGTEDDSRGSELDDELKAMEELTAMENDEADEVEESMNKEADNQTDENDKPNDDNTTKPQNRQDVPGRDDDSLDDHDVYTDSDDDDRSHHSGHAGSDHASTPALENEAGYRSDDGTEDLEGSAELNISVGSGKEVMPNDDETDSDGQSNSDDNDEDAAVERNGTGNEVSKDGDIVFV